MTEIWKDIVGYEGLYQVSNLGRLKRISRVRSDGKLLKELIKKNTPRKGDGYLQISLGTRSHTQKSRYLHQIVATAFIPNPENKRFVNHKNGIKADNRVENLEWCTYQENMDHAVETGLQNTKGENNLQHKLKEVTVLEIRSKYDPNISKPLKKLSIEFGLPNWHIHSIVKRKTWKHI